MDLRIIYDSVLREKSRPVEIFDDSLPALADEMFAVMKKHNGLGLAAPQVGISERVIVFGYEPTSAEDELPRIPFTALVNPVVAKFSQEKETMEEGCLSLPGLELPVTRSAGVTVQAQTLKGEPVTIKAKGLLARILQHEIDHLDGILFTDRADGFAKLSDYRYARIVFFGSDNFSLPVLNSLLDAKLNVIAVVTETDKPAGRGQELVSTPIKQFATEHGVAVFQPAEKSDIAPILEQLDPDLVVLASYGKILPAATLAVPIYGSLNVHPSLLPMYRGATPIQTAILAGDAETGVTIMAMAPQVDAGGVIAQERAAIQPSDTSVTLRERLADLGAKLLLASIPPYLAGQSKIVTQDESAVTSTSKLTKEMAEIDWTKPLVEIDRQIRALQPWPGAFTWLEGKRLKFLESAMASSRLVIGRVQLEGKNPSAWADFERGYADVLKKSHWYGKIS